MDGREGLTAAVPALQFVGLWHGQTLCLLFGLLLGLMPGCLFGERFPFVHLTLGFPIRSARVLRTMILPGLILAGVPSAGAAGPAVHQSVLDGPETWSVKVAAKISYLGLAGKPIATVLIHTPGSHFTLADFAPLHRAHKLYPNDDSSRVLTFKVTAREFSDMLRALKPVLSDPEVSRGPKFLSFSVLRAGSGVPEGHEFRIGLQAGEMFYRAALGALGRENEAGRQILNKQWGEVYAH